MDVQPYVLAELEYFSLSSSLKSSQRIKFTCVDASQSFIVLGATSGGIYVFQRQPCIFLQLIPNTEGAITQVSVSPNENMFAFSTIKGFVFLVDHNIFPSSTGGVRKVQVSSDHHGAEVTAFQWSHNSNDLYIGDDKGKISVASVSFFMAKTIFPSPSFTLMELDSKVVQMDLHSNYLLVSTLTRSYVCDTIQEQYKRIGSKPRNGIFGACFQEVISCNTSLFNEGSPSDPPTNGDSGGHCSDGDNVRIFCARPGARLWEVGIGGDVVSTHKFGEVLTIPPVPIVTINHDQVPQGEESIVPGFTKLFTLGNRFLFTYEHHSVYVMDPENARVVLWSELDHEEIIDARTIGNVVYLWSGSLLALTLLTVEECLLALFSLERFQDCIDLCLKHLDYLNGHARCILPLGDLLKHVTSIPEQMAPLMKEIERLAEIGDERTVPQLRMFKRLGTGMYVIRNESGADGKCLCDNRGGVTVVRSRSASPGTTLRNTHVAIKEGVKKGHHPAGGSLYASNVPFSSLPDFAEAGGDRGEEESIFKAAVMYNHVHGEEVKQKESKTSVQPSKNSIEAISMKLVEGTMTIREKWQELGGKVRSFGWDSTVETMDCDIANIGDDMSEDLNQEITAYEDEVIVQSRNRLLKKSMSVPDTKQLPETKSLHPVLDLENIIDVCRKLADEGYEQSSLYSIFDLVFSAFQSFLDKSQELSLVAINKEDGAIKNLVQSGEEVLPLMPFPFRFYLNESVITVILSSLEMMVCSNNSSWWLEQKFGNLAMREPYIHPTLKKSYTPQQLRDDMNLCALIDPFLEIIDPLRILECLGESSCPCRFILWCKVVELVISKSNEKTMKPLNSSSRNDQRSSILATFPFLLTEFQKVGQSNLSKLLTDTPKILRKEIVPQRHCLYIIFWLCGSSQTQDWCSSLLSILVLDFNDTQDNIFQLCAIDAFTKINEDASSEAFCFCGFPRKWAPSYSSPRFASVGVRLARGLWSSGNRDGCLRLCWKTGLWRWLMWFLHARYQSKEEEEAFLKVSHMMSPLGWDKTRGCWDLGIISLLATFADRWCLEEWLEEMDEVAWKKFLAIWVDVKSGNCQGCKAIGRHSSGIQCTGEIGNESVITWTEVGNLMIGSLGAEASCTVLMDSSFLNGVGQLDVSFYKLCVLAAVASGAAQDKPMMQSLTRMLLSQEATSKALYSPKVAQMVEDSLLKDSYDWLSSVGGGQVPLPLSCSKSSNHHWGRAFSFGSGASCSRCSLPLASQVLLSGNPGGVLVLPCGHSIHAVCVRSIVKCCPLGCPQSHAGGGSN